MNAPDLLALLEHADRHVRDEAFDRIAAGRDRALLEPLAQKARTQDPYVEALFCRFLEHMPPDEAVPHLKTLVESPNGATRGHALDALNALPTTYLLDALVDLLGYRDPDVILHALRQLGVHKRATGIRQIASLLSSDDPEISEAAFDAIEKIDSPRSIRYVMPFLHSGNPTQQILALHTLGRMSCFRKWRRLLPSLQSPEASVREAAVLNVSRKAGRKAHRFFIAHLEAEEEEGVVRLILNRMAHQPNDAATATLVGMASTHPNPQIRRAAGWIIEELDAGLLRRNMLARLSRGTEEEHAYILIKMGQRQLPDCGRVIASYVDRSKPVRVRNAALEGLGFLGLRDFLPAVEPYIRSSDPMEAYVATLAAVRMIDRIDDCPELTRLLLSPPGEGGVLKQVVLQYMIDSISWSFDDSTLLEILKRNLESESGNVYYLSVILTGRSRQRDFVPLLVPIAAGDADRDVRQVARSALDEILGGDLSYFFDALLHGDLTPAEQVSFLALMARLRWGRGSAVRGLELLDAFHAREGDAVFSRIMEDIATAVYRAAPELAGDFLRADRRGAPWRLTVGRAWLGSLQEVTRPEEREDWKSVFGQDDPGLMRAALQLAVEVKAAWAVETILQRIPRCPDEALKQDMRAAVKEILGF